MKRRTLALALAGILVVSAIPFTGAFTSVSADRTVSVAVAGDRDAFLGLEPSDSPDGAHARIDDGRLELVFDGSTPGIDGEGLNPDATTRFSNVYNVTNQGTQAVGVSVRDGSTGVRFFTDGVRIDDEHRNVTLQPGETISVDIVFETGVNETLESLDSVTIVAAASAVNQTDGDSGDLPDDGDGEDSDETGNDDSSDGTTILTTERRGVNTYTAPSTQVAAGTTATLALGSTPVGRQTGVSVEGIAVTMTDNTTLSPTVRRPRVPDESVPSLPTADGNGRVLSYVAVDHPNLTDDQIAGATFTITVSKSVVDGPPSNFTAYRYHGDTWESVETTLVEKSSSAYTYRVDSPGLSLFTMIWEKARERGTLQQPSAIKEVSIVKSVDRDSDGRISDFDVRVRANTTLRGLDPDGSSEPFFEVAINGKPLPDYEVAPRENGTYRIPVTWEDLHWGATPGENRITVTLKEDDRAEMSELGVDTADEATATVDYERVQNDGDVNGTTARLVRTSTVVYQEYDQRYLAESWWQNESVESANLAARQLRRIIKSQLPSTPTTGAEAAQFAAMKGVERKFGRLGSRVLSGYQLGNMFLYSGTAALAMYGSVQKKAVEIHLDRPGYTAAQYDELHSDLRALDSNSERLQRAVQNDNTAKKHELLRERLDLLRDLRATLPAYQKGYYRSVARNAAGSEDLHAYRTVWRALDSLRMHVRSDYRMTRLLLDGNQPPMRGSEMPTHGWQLDDRTVIYDTLETSNDYTTYRVTVPEDAAGKSIELTLDGAKVDRFTAEVGQRAPTAGTVPDGVRMDEYHVGSAPRRSYTLKDAESGTYYLTVRSVGAHGSFRLTVDRGIPVSVLAREGPDVQRPVVTLTEAPPAEPLRTGHPVRVSEESSVDLEWRAWDDKTAADLRYSLRVDNGTGFSDWSAWRSVGSDRQIETAYDFSDGVHRVQLRVRDGAGMQAVRNIDVVVSKFTPQVALEDVPDSASNAFFVRVLPERRVDRVEFEYRPAGNETWRDWKTLDNTTDLGRLTFNHTGEYVIRSRAVTLTGNKSTWAQTALTYTPPDTTAPHVRLEQAPALDTYENGTTARVTDAETVAVEWSVAPQNSPTSEVEFRRQVDGEWSAWRSLPADGHIEVTRSSPGPHTIRIQARDAAGNTNTSTVTYRIDRTVPSTTLNASGDAENAVLYTATSEPVAYLDVAYRQDGTWRPAGTLVAPGSHSVSLPNGTLPVRVRAVDYAGNVGPWSNTETVHVFPANQTGVTIDLPDESVSGGENVTIPGGSVPDLGEGYRVFMDVLLPKLDGKLLLDIYMTTRERRDLKLKTVEFSVRGNQTVAADLPRSLTNDTELMVRVRGNGTAVLDSLRAIDAAPSKPPIRVSPATPTVDESVTLETSVDGPSGYIQSVTWNVSGDSRADLNGTTANWTPETAGDRTVAVTVTDIFGAASTNRTVVAVNAPPQAAVAPVGVETPVFTDETVTLTAANSSDRDDDALSVEWDIDGDADFERAGKTVDLAYADEGNYTVRVRVTDSAGATDVKAYNLSVENRAPHVVADHQPRVPLRGESVTFDATESSDPDGSVETVAWDFDADGTVDATGATVEHAFDEAGTHGVRVRITDDDGATNTTLLSVYVNRPPVARLNLTTPVLTGERVIADATNSTDPDGQLTQYDWSVEGTDIDVNETRLTQSFEDDGIYVVTVQVTDEYGAIDAVSANLTVRNRAPNANASVATDVPVRSETTRLTAAGSSDPDGQVESYDWDVDGDGVTDATGRNVSHVFEQAGPTTVNVSMTDDDGATDTATLTVDVNAPPEPALTVPDGVRTGEAATLDATASVDPDGTITSSTWHIETLGRLGAHETVNVSLSDDGNYTVTLTVTDDRGTTRSTHSTLTVRNRPPNASFSLQWDRGAYPNLNESTRLVDASHDRDGNIVDYRWLVDGDVVAQNGTASYRFTEPGNHTIGLRVTDDDGATDMTTESVHVNHPPTARFEPVDTITVGEPFTLRATNSTDLEGEPLDYTWRAGNVTIITSSNATVEVDDLSDEQARALLEREEITLTVTDAEGATDTATQNVTVRPRELSVNITGPSTIPVGEENGDVFTVSRDGTTYDITNVTWSVPDAPNATVDTSVTKTHWEAYVSDFETPGNYTVQATVTTESGTVFELAIPVTVVETLDVSISTNAPVEAGDSLSLEATISNEGVDLTESMWTVATDNQTLATVRNETATTVSLDEPGTYRIGFAAETENGTTATDVTYVDIAPRVPRTSVYLSTYFGGRIVTGSAYSYYEYDGLEAEVTYAWDVDDDGDFERSGSTVDLRYDAPTTRTIRVRVTDRDGDSRIVMRNLSVDPSENISVRWAGEGRTLAHSSEFVFVNVDSGGSGVQSGAEEAQNIAAYHRSNGTLAWSTSLLSAWTAQYTNGSLYIRGENTTARLDAQTGSVVWSRTIESDSEAFRVAEDALFLSSENGTTALARADGSVRWRTPFDGYVSVEAIGPQRVYVESYDLGQVVALDRATGERIWSRPHAWEVTWSNGTLVTLQGDTIASVDPATGETLWTYTERQSVNSYVVRDETVYLSAGWQNGSVLAVSGGELQWRVETAEYPGKIGVSGDHIVFSDDRGLVAVDRSTGNEQWDIAAEGVYDFRLQDETLVTNADVTGDRRDEVTVVDVETGTIRWTASSRSYLGDPLVDGRTLYFDGEGFVYRVEIDANTTTETTNETSG